MNTYSSPSAYRYCIVRLSTVAVSTLVPALNVRSTTLPDSTFFSVVRTNAPPLPGFTCWNSTTVQRSPSRLSTRPFLRSFVVAISFRVSFESRGLRDPQQSTRAREDSSRGRRLATRVWQSAPDVQPSRIRGRGDRRHQPGTGFRRL